MSATTHEAPTLDVSGTSRIPLTRLVRAELRKLVDTRASRWLLIAIAVITVVAIAIAIVIAVALAALATTLDGADDAWTGIGPDDFAKFGLLQVSALLQGLAFGLLFSNSAAAIVTYFVLPTAFTIVASIWGALADAAPWIDLGTAQQPLFGGQDLTGEQWWQVVTSSVIWVVLPFIVGVVRVLRAEVK